MKPLFCYSTILFYSLFSFAFASICPAVCLTIDVETVCEALCGEPVVECQSRCTQSCSNVCIEIEPSACCSGAYGTQNSLRLATECPAPDKSHAYTELNRLLRDIDIPIAAGTVDQFVTPICEFGGVYLAPQSSLISNIISTTVLRI